ncbi:hypothetical protein [Aquabacterium sp.]|nr:hypothetical protein [Aquabacterium sp.]HSW08027.1 hypothetical protein [Aquabacterium sp.]
MKRPIVAVLLALHVSLAWALEVHFQPVADNVHASATRTSHRAAPS